MKRKPGCIEDLDQFKSLKNQLRGFKTLKSFVSLLRPLLKRMGVDVSRLDSVFKAFDANAMEAELEGLMKLPDKFNQLFCSHGWIMYESMNVEVAQEAIQAAEQGDMEKAESILVAYHAPAAVEMALLRMMAVDAFQPRMRLARLALEDYREKRYHACIPVVLALIDGLVNEVYAKAHGVRRGFFARGADLTAWDSIAAHEAGLGRLVELFRRGFQRTREERVEIPYRHGIIHGILLGYDNELVAAKAWAALFSVREWAVKAQRGELKAPSQKAEASWSDLLDQHRRIQETRRKLDAWKARDVQVGQGIPATGSPSDYEEASPERMLVEFLGHWKTKNYGHMARSLKGIALGGSESPGKVREYFQDLQLESFECLKITDIAPAMTEARIRIEVVRGGERSTEEILIRLVSIDSKGSPAIGGTEGSTWTMGNWEALTIASS